MLLLGVVVIFGVVAFWRMQPPQRQADPTKMPKPVQTQQVIPRPLDVVYRTRGSLEALRRIDMNAEAPAIIRRILFHEGDVVRQGQRLIELKAQRQLAQLQEAQAASAASQTLYDLRGSEIAKAQAQLQSAQAQLGLAQSEFNKYQQLFQENYVSQLELDQKSAALQTAKAVASEAAQELNRVQSVKTQTSRQVQEAKARVAINQALVGEMVLVAPFSGTIGEKYVNEGDYVLNTEKLLTLVDNRHIQVRFTVPERLSVYLKEGATVQLLDGASRPITTGTVCFIAPSVDANTRSITIKADVQPVSGVTLRDGQFVDVVLTLFQDANGLAIPESALVPEGEKFFVYVQRRLRGADGQRVLKAERRIVTIGQRRDGQVQITSGLRAGETVVTAGTQKLFDGALLQPLKNDSSVPGTTSKGS